MRAVCVHDWGLEHTRLAELPSPPLTADGVRIQVQASGVSFANLLAIDGKHQNRSTPPFVPGTEVAGIVAEVGDQVEDMRVGDRVLASVRSGGFATEVVAPAMNVHHLPEAVDMVAAVHFPTIYATAYAALKWRAAIQPGESLLVHAAGGGSGLAAIDIGRQLGARILATAGSPAKRAAALAQGAEMVWDSRAGFREGVLAATHGRGADVIFDPVGGDVFDESLRCIAADGRVIPMGFASGRIPQIPANIVLVKNITVIGLYWGYYTGWAHQQPPRTMQLRLREGFAELLGWAATGRLRPHTWKVYPLADFRAALSALSSGEVIGRVALTP